MKSSGRGLSHLQKQVSLRQRATDAFSQRALETILYLTEAGGSSDPDEIELLLERLTHDDIDRLWRLKSALFLQGTSIKSYALDHNLPGKLKYLKAQLLWEAEQRATAQRHEEKVGSELEVAVTVSATLCDWLLPPEQAQRAGWKADGRSPVAGALQVKMPRIRRSD